MERKIFTGEGHYHYVTFICHGRRKLLSDPRAKQIVIQVLSKQTVKYKAKLAGFVIMPNHVHAIFGYELDMKMKKNTQFLYRNGRG